MSDQKECVANERWKPKVFPKPLLAELFSFIPSPLSACKPIVWPKSSPPSPSPEFQPSVTLKKRESLFWDKIEQHAYVVYIGNLLVITIMKGGGGGVMTERQLISLRISQT